MRLVGTVLFAAWMLAWLVAPKGEQARATSTVGGLAIAGNDAETAVAWLEVSHARPRTSETLHVATVSGGRVTPRLHLDGRDDVAYRLADAGAGRFVLVSEHRNRVDRWFELRRFGKGDVSRPADLRATFNASTWEVAAAGDRIVLVEEDANGGETSVHQLDDDDQWMPSQAAGRTLISSNGTAMVRYEVGRGGDKVWYTPAQGNGWSMEVTRPHCVVPSMPPAASPTSTGAEPVKVPVVLPEAREKVVSVAPLSGGYARLVRLGPWLCGDGTRDGQYVPIKPVPLGSVVDPRLVADAAGRLALTDANEGKGSLYLRSLEPVANAPAFGWLDHPLAIHLGGPHRGYAIVEVGASGASALLTRSVRGETQVVLQRYATFAQPPLALAGSSPQPPRPASEILLGPTPHYRADHRRLMMSLALVPLAALALALAHALGLLRRLRRVVPPSSNAPLPSGSVAIEAQLARDADAPTGALRLRRAGAPLLLHIEGAEVLRASEVRSHREPRGDAVDVASGAPVVATGRLQRGAMFRGEDSLRAGRGDLVLVGCTLAEAKARVAARVVTSATLLGGAIATAAYFMH